MKKLIALLLVAVMALGMVACDAAEEGSSNDTKKETETNPASEVLVNSAVEVLEGIWAKYAEDEKFFAMGGDYNAPVDGAPGIVDVFTTDFLMASLLVPEAELEKLTEAASLIHAMNANTFTGAAYAVSDASAFATAMQTAIQNNQWMCGFPEKLIIANVGGYVVVAYGVNDTMNVFETHLNDAFPGSKILVNEAIGG